MRTIYILIVCIIVGAGFVACQAVNPVATAPDVVDPTTAPRESTAAAQTPVEMETPEMSTPVTPDPAAEPLVSLVKGHLAQQLGIPTEEIVLTKITPVVWRDMGLGCPKPNIDYAQIETPGYNIFLEAQGQEYNYHTDKTKRFVPCRS